jgi:hypothetical protein
MTMLHPAPAATAGLAALHALLSADAAPADGTRRRLAPRPDLFNTIVEQARLAHFDTKTGRAIKYTTGAYALGFQAAKAGELHAAEAEFARAEEIFARQQADYSPQALAFLSCLTRPYWAYYYYRRGQFDASVEKTLSAVASITQLEGEISIFHMARVQQLHNLSRVSFKRGDLDAGAALVHELLRYLAAGTPGTLPGSWAPALLHHTPPALRADMFSQIFLEMVTHLLREPQASQRRHLFGLAFGPLASLTATVDFWPPFQAWLAAYEALLTGEAHAYAPLLTACLAAPPDHHLDVLPLALLLELHRGLPAPAAGPAASLRPLLPAYARRTLWLDERALALLA